MHKLQEAVRLHRMGQSDRSIARQLKLGLNTLRQYFELITKVGLLDEPPEDLSDAGDLRRLVDERLSRPEPPEQQRSSVDRYRDKVAAFVRKGVGPTPIHDFLRTHETDYDCSLSAVKRLVIRLRKELGPCAEDAAIPVETVAGEVAQVDFGYVGMTYDPAQGLIRHPGFSQGSSLRKILVQCLVFLGLLQLSHRNSRSTRHLFPTET